MNDNNAPHYTEPPITQHDEDKRQIDGLPASHNTQLAKLTRNILNGSDIKVTVFSTPKCNLEWSSPCSGRPLLS